MKRLFVVLLLTGCAPMQYERIGGGGTDAEFQQAMARCRSGTAFIPPPRTGGVGDQFQHAGAVEGYMDDCLRGQGWAPAPRSATPR